MRMLELEERSGKISELEYQERSQIIAILQCWYEQKDLKKREVGLGNELMCAAENMEDWVTEP